MSNPIQAITTVAGAVLGFFFLGGPVGALKGAYWGYMAGQIIDPTDLPNVRGPRLEDLKSQSSMVGGPVPLVFGTMAISGNIIWADDLTETKHKDTQGGKGGPSQTSITYSYSQKFAVGLCESPLEGMAAIQGIRKIWANGKLIYDKTNPLFDFDIGDFIEHPHNFGEFFIQLFQKAFRKLAANSNLETIMAVYDGTQTTADPTIESVEGVGNVPAYMGLAYVVFDEMQLADYGNRAPELLFEVFTSGNLTELNLDQYSNEVLYPWVLGSADPVNSLNTNDYNAIGGPPPASYPSFEAYMAAYYPTWPLHIFGYNVVDSVSSLIYPSEGSPGSFEGVSIYIHINCLVPGTQYDYLAYHSIASGVGPPPLLSDLMPLAEFFWWSGNASLAGEYSHFPAGLWHFIDGTMNYTTDYAPDLAGLTDPNGSVAYAPFSPNGPAYNVLYDNRIRVDRAPAAPPNVEDGWIAIPDSPGNYIDELGTVHKEHDWVLDTSTTYKVLQKFAVSGTTVTKYPLNPVRPLGNAHYNDAAFWTAAYNDAVAEGTMASGLSYGTDYPKTQSFAYIDNNHPDVVDVYPVPVADIVSILCQRSGLTTGEIDVTDIDSETDGFVVGTMMDGRAAIQPLAMFGLFGAIEADGKLKFIERGGAIAETLEYEDLCAHLAESDRPPAVDITRKQDVELPCTIRVSYNSPQRDYQPGQQIATRVSTGAINAVDVQLPISLSDERGLQLAEIYLYDAWTARNGYKFAIDISHFALTPTDVVGVPVDGNVERVRITSMGLSLFGALQCEGLRDDENDLVSYATRPAPDGEDTLDNDPEIPLVGPTDLVLLDLPGLRAIDNDAGYYAAGRGYTPTWSGYAVLRSFDGGTEYTTIATSTDAATMGSLDMAFEGTDNSIEVTLASGTFSSATSAQLDAGANVIAVGAHGRWELLQFETAVLDTGDTWTLSDLRRGVHGTEANELSSVEGDRVVLMSGAGILRVPLVASLVNVEHLVKGVTLGNTAQDTPAVSFTSAGLSLQGGGITYDPNDNLVSDEIYRQVFGP